MRSGTMFVLSDSSVQQMGSQPKSSVIFLLIFGLLTLSVQQGELAHKIVKRLYGATNKRNAELQIAKRYRRLERASRALARKRLHNHKRPKAMEQGDTHADSELRYHISPSKNNPQDIFSTIRDN